MFQQGDRVVYGIHGVCVILDVEQRTVDRKKLDYLVLCPLDQSETRFYVPVHNQAAVAKLHPLLTKQELDSLLQSAATEHNDWITDENLRKQHYRTMIGSGDRIALIGMIQALYKHKSNQLASGKKFHLCDENFLRDAQKLLSGEIAIVLGISQNEATDYIKNKFAFNDKSAAE